MSSGLQPATPTTPPPSLNSPGPDGGLPVDTWDPPNPLQDDNFTTAGNWSTGVVPGTNGITSAVFNGTVSNTPCVINTNPLVAFHLLGGYNSDMYADNPTVQITGYVDDDYASDNLVLVDETDDSNINFGAIGGYSAAFPFGNLTIEGSASSYKVNFLAGSNSSLGENPSGGSCSVSIAAPGGITVNAGQLNIGDCNNYGSSTVQVNTPTITVTGINGISPVLGFLNFYGDHTGASQLISAAGTDGTTINLGGTSGQMNADLYFVNDDPNYSTQTLSDVGISIGQQGTLVSATGGEWAATFVNVKGGTIQIGTNASNPTPTFDFAEGLGEDVTSTSLILVGSNCNVTYDVELNDGTTKFLNTYVMKVRNATIGGITLNMYLNIPSATASQIVASNTITINSTGSTLYMNGQGNANPYQGETWTLLDADNGVSGSFGAQQYTPNLESTVAEQYGAAYWKAYYLGV